MLKRFFVAALPVAAVSAMAAPAQADAISDFYKGKQINAISGGGAGGGFSFVARVMALRAAFDKTVADPAFLAEAKKRNMVVAPVRGEKLDAIVAAAMKTSPALIKKFKKMVKIDKVKPRKRKKKK